MRSPTRTTINRAAVGALVLALGALAAVPASDALAMKRKGSATWRRIATKLRASVKTEARADFLLELARASLLEGEDRSEAIADARAELRETRRLANAQYRARLELADALGETVPYSVDLDDITFVDGIDHDLLPYAVGNTWTYEGETDEGTETIVVTVLDETKDILGVNCTVVRDTVTLDDEVIEDTWDWYAQDSDGNVWYFGELSFEYEDGDIVGTEGSWKSGVDGALPGIVMKAMPAVGDVYRQEFLLGEAEDWARVLAVDDEVSLDIGDFSDCVRTLDALPIEPDALEHKYYAPGIGLVLETSADDPDDGRVELISTNLIP